MRFAILGEIEISHPELRPSPRSMRHRLLIAALLLAENRPVPIRQLRKTLWGDTVPDGADLEIEGLRRDWSEYLAGDPVCELRQRGDCLILWVEADEHDVLRLRRLITKALQQLELRRHTEALRVLDEAADLWRGTPAAGLSGHGIDEPVGELVGIKAKLDRMRFEVQAHLGRFGDITDEARHALACQPYSEDATRRIMIGLYQTGRAVEAQRAYRSLEQRLLERSGRRPNRELQELNATIRADGPILSSEVPPPPEFGTLRQLPAPVPDFVGRTAALDRLDRSRSGGTGAAVVSGPGGVGKTWLGLAWAHRRLRDFPDGQLYADLRGASLDEPADPLAVLHAFLRALGFASSALPDDLDSASEEFRDYLAGRRVLVFLDNAADAAQVRPLLAGPGSSFTIVTGRNRLRELSDEGRADGLGLAELPADEALELLRAHIGPGPIASDPESAQRIAERCGGLPLALRIAAELHPDLGLAAIAARLKERPIGALRVPGADRADLRHVLHLSYRHLGEAEQRLHLVLAPLPGPDFSAGLALSLAGRLDGADPGRLIDTLVASHWLRASAPGRYEAHNLVAAYAEAIAEDRFDAAERALWRDLVIAHVRRCGPDLPDADFEFVTAAYQAWWMYPNASRLAGGLSVFAQRGHRVAELVRLGERGAAAAAPLGPADRARHCNLVEVAAFKLGDFEKAAAYGRLTLDALESTPGGDRIGTARTNLGGALIELGRRDEAGPMLGAALAAAESARAWDAVVGTLRAQTRLHRAEGDVHAAEECLVRAAAIDRERCGSRRADAIAAQLDGLPRRGPVAAGPTEGGKA